MKQNLNLVASFCRQKERLMKFRYRRETLRTSRAGNLLIQKKDPKMLSGYLFLAHQRLCMLG